MIVEYVSYHLKTDPAAFELAYARAAESLRAASTCLAWELSRCQEEPNRYMLRIEWESLQGHIEGFRKSAEFQTFFAAIKPYFEQIQEMHHYQITKVRSQTLFAAMGGAETFFRIARLMHERMCHDDLLGDKFTKADATHVPHLGMWLCEVFGGPKLLILAA